VLHFVRGILITKRTWLKLTSKFTEKRVVALCNSQRFGRIFAGCMILMLQFKREILVEIYRL
jgi:hypothetical protein